MSATNDRQRDERSFDMLIASQLRRERDITDLNDLPELTPDELKAMNTIPDNIIEKLWTAEASCKNAPDVDEPPTEDGDCALAGAGDEAYAGFYRAPNMDSEDRDTLDQSRKEALEELERTARKQRSRKRAK
jgi:hypothetical protein